MVAPAGGRLWRNWRLAANGGGGWRASLRDCAGCWPPRPRGRPGASAPLERLTRRPRLQNLYSRAIGRLHPAIMLEIGRVGGPGLRGPSYETGGLRAESRHLRLPLPAAGSDHPAAALPTLFDRPPPA